MSDREQPTKYITILRGVYNRLEKKVEELEEEKQKLEEENKELRKAIKQWNINGGNLLKENTKLKKALDILIRKLDIHLTKTENYDTAETYYSVYNDNACEILYPEEYELLKEVLKNE